MPQFTRTRNEDHQQGQRKPSGGLPLKDIDSPKQAAQLLGVRDCGARLDCGPDQGSFQRSGRIAFGKRVRYGISEDGADFRPQALGRFVCSRVSTLRRQARTKAEAISVMGFFPKLSIAMPKSHSFLVLVAAARPSFASFAMKSNANTSKVLPRRRRS